MNTIDFLGLRGRLSLHKPGDEDKMIGISEGDFRALVEAVDVAQAVAESSVTNRFTDEGREEVLGMDDLRAALARFDFGDERRTG